jgi:hypothetical protein
MKKLFTLLAFVASVSLATAQTTPKAAPKAETKKECKKGDKCCSKESKDKSPAAETKGKASKKN